MKGRGRTLPPPPPSFVEEPTRPGVPPPGMPQDMEGSDEADPIPTVDETHRIADALDNFALFQHAHSAATHLLAQEIRRRADGRPLGIHEREKIANGYRGLGVQAFVLADTIHPEGARRT